MAILTVFGTRPECIKLAPVIKELKRQGIPHKVCVTARHREMLDPFLRFFGIRVDYDLDIMQPNQDLYHVTTEALLKLMGQAYLILTDSSGIQEEAPTLRKPVLVLWETTEQPEGLQVGVAKLAGTEQATLSIQFKACLRLLQSQILLRNAYVS